ncbi:MAG: transporter substrate-binding domain-containing protein [Hymenobacteraceae bacterium]|nr:transporter substrate-binding domain-containing protein [Hymenobacteraceae bacterium]MDX5395303.1 transporter substrate-binding domain-containing protein [Hymenobacteraceae bacterium]MDX5511339.1 transporter substrate-binding domain-containing protein [Hymenobacteraceae bacterium]
MKQNLFVIFALIFLQSCDNFPKDPEDTLNKVTNGTLKIGYSENPPWVVKTAGAPTGVEPDLLKAFAQSINAEIEWTNDTEQNLFEDLEKEKLHIVIGGITKSTPWKAKVGITRMYVEDADRKHVMAVIRGENAFIVELEKFLFQHEAQIKTKLSHEKAAKI